MRHTRLVAAFLLLGPFATARAQDRPPSRFGGFVGFDTNIGSIRSETGYFAGAEVAAIFQQQFTLGFAGYGLANNEARIPGAPGVTDRLRFAYGGIRVGYICAPSARIHAVADLLVGSGETRARGSLPQREDRVLVAEPSVVAEANLSRFLRGALGVSYRFVSGSNLTGVSNADLDGLTGRLTVRAGWF